MLRSLFKFVKLTFLVIITAQYVKKIAIYLHFLKILRFNYKREFKKKVWKGEGAHLLLVAAEELWL